MATKWDSVEVQTEKVIDENPEVWVAAAKKSLEDKNYSEALDNAEQAIEFINKAATSAARSLLPKCYAIEIYAHYEKGEGSKAQKIKSEHFDAELKRFLMDNPEYVIVFKWHNNSEWMPLWQEMIAEWVKTDNFARIEEYIRQSFYVRELVALLERQPPFIQRDCYGVFARVLVDDCTEQRSQPAGGISA